MPEVATTTPASRATVAHADRARKQAEAERAAEALNGYRADTTTPLETVGKAPLADVPEPPRAERAKAARSFTFSTEIAYKGRVITVHAQGMTLSEFSALLDAHGFVAAEEVSCEH